jgi:hypothetical protein
MVKEIRVYVCPTPDCANFYGSSSMGDLTQKLNHRTSMRNLANEDPSEWGKVTGSRAECPYCRDRGIKVERELHVLTVTTPDVVACSLNA